MMRRKLLREGHPTIATSLSGLAVCLTRMGRYADAEELLLEAHQILDAALGEQHDHTQTNISRLVELYEAWDEPAKAAEFRARLAPE